MSLKTVPIEMLGSWEQSPPEIAQQLLSRMRAACLRDVSLLSDRQPNKLRVEHRSGCYPAIWLHDEDSSLAWVLVSIKPSAWRQLMYQFGHELGHVVCNSWNRQSIPKAPCQWLEESLVEAFTIRGLTVLAKNWERRKPEFASSMFQYRDHLIAQYQSYSPADLGSWFRSQKDRLDRQGGESEAEGPATLAILHELEAARSCIADLGALNRWPERTGVPVDIYLNLWKKSCTEIGAEGLLPGRLKRLLEI